MVARQIDPLLRVISIPPRLGVDFLELLRSIFDIQIDVCLIGGVNLNCWMICGK